MYNRVILMGRLTADPELSQTQSGVSLCRFNVAVDRGYAKQGEEKQTDFFNVTCWRQTAEFVCRYFSKGRMIHVEGRLQNDNYTDQNNVKHYRTAIIAENVSFCGDKSQNAQIAPSQPSGGVYGTNYAPNPASPYNGVQTPQNAYQQNGVYPNQYQQPAPSAQQYQQQTLPGQGYTPQSSGNPLDDFEKILNDGEVPF